MRTLAIIIPNDKKQKQKKQKATGSSADARETSGGGKSVTSGIENRYESSNRPTSLRDNR